MMDEPGLNKPAIAVAVAVVVIAAGGWFFWRSHHAATPPPAVAEAPSATVAPAPEDVISHPVPPPTAPATSAPLPMLGDSDASFNQALTDSTADASIMQFLLPTDLIRHIVVSVDNLPRQKVAVAKRPTVPVNDTFIADGDELHATLDPQNFARYQPAVNALKKVDMQRLVAVYLRFYPLFQQAYQDLGYPNGYFNDRLVQVIDGLLATPQVTGPIELTRPNVMYVFADPSLEARPAGQKLLIRMGPDNAAVVKAKLTELRAAILAAQPKH